MLKKNIKWFGIGTLVLVFLVGVIVFFTNKSEIRSPGFMDSILSNFGIDDVDYVGGMKVEIKSYLSSDVVDLDKYEINTDILAKIFSKFGYPEEYTDLMMFPSTKHIIPKVLTIEFRDINFLTQEMKDKLVFQTFSNEELLLGYDSKYISEKAELVYTIYVSEGQLRSRLANYGKTDVVSSLTYNLIDVVQLGLYHEDGNEYDDKYNLEIFEEIRENPLFVVKKGVLGRLNEWIVRPVYAEVRCIGQWSCPQATRVCTCSVSGYNLECSQTGQPCGPGGTCSCSFTSTCSGVNSTFACDWEITMDRGCQLQSVSCTGPQFCSTTASAFDCYASAFPDPVTPPPTNTPIPTNTPRPGCTCGPCGVCLSPGTYADSCLNAGACTCCGTTTSPTPTIPNSCPPGTVCTCQPEANSCGGTKVFVGGCSNPSDWCCCTNTPGCCDGVAYAMVYVYEDLNRNGVWDNTEAQVRVASDPRMSGARLSWNSTFPCSSANGSSLNTENVISGRVSAQRNWNTPSQWPPNYAWDGCCTSTSYDDGCCGELKVDANDVGLPIEVEYGASRSQVPSGFDFNKIRNNNWGGITDCYNTVMWGADTGEPAHSFWQIAIRNGCNATSDAVFRLTMPTGSTYVPSGPSVSRLESPTGGCQNDLQLYAIGIQPPLPNPPTSPSLVISNVSNVTVAAVSGRNHICQDEFRLSSNSRRVKFWVSASDADGASDIATIALRFNNNSGATEYMRLTAINLNTASPGYLPISGGGGNASIVNFQYQSVGNVRTAIFTVEFSQNYVPYLYDLDIYAQDVGGQTLAWTDAGRDFKVWDCQVPVSGTVYDASGVSVNCPTVGYSTAVETGYFSGLIFDDTTVSNIDKTMNPAAPNYSSSVGNHLIWGVSYTANFAGLLGTDPGNRRITDLVDNSVNCSAVSNDRTVIINESSGFDAYDIGSADVDFTTVADQDPWWQGRGVSILGITSVTSDVPATCRLTDGCTPALTIDNTPQNDNGAVVSSSLGLSAGEWGYSDNWYIGGHAQTYLPNLTYGQMHSELFDGKGVGREESNWAGVIGVGGTGLVFVTGPLTIDSDHTVAPGGFLMVVVNGNITINENVTRLDGAYVASGGQILIGGENDTALTINGMLYATNNIDISRGFDTDASNNLNPAVVIDMRPDLIFNAPSYMFDNRTRL